MTPTTRWALAQRRKRLVITRTVLERSLQDLRREESMTVPATDAARAPAA